MRRVRARDTKPELVVRKLLHGLGYRYRVSPREHPGKPDLAFTRRRAAVFVHGCFWHGHGCKRGARLPKANSEYWSSKIARNRARDVRVQSELQSAGWGVLTVWECELRNEPYLIARLTDFLGPPVI
jgi:DNA mismatch endonuclease (patch repair protein)